MLTSEERAYYSRQILIDEIGQAGQQKLSEAKVLIIGAGGLGCPVLQYISAAGVGNIGVVDGDVVDVSNLHRQILFGMDSIGKNKSIEAVNVLEKHNPFIRFKAYPINLSAENAVELFSEYDIVVDCSDNYETRFLVNDACVLLNKPLVYGAIYRFEGQVSVFNYKNGPTYRCLYPDMPTQESTTNCSMSGVIGVLPGIIGLLQANEVLKIITGFGDVLNGKILVFNAQKNTFDTYELFRNSELKYDTLLQNNLLHAANYTHACSVGNDEQMYIDHKSLLESAETGEYLILDVRDREESPIFIADGVLQIPLKELRSKLNEIPVSRKIAVVCKSGFRSGKAIELLQRELNLKELKNLENGISQQFITAWKSKKEN
jgi:adenylyltransferase/sulfurtransferase